MSRGVAQQLARAYPDLRINVEEVSIGPGWLPIVERLCDEPRRIAQGTGGPIRIQHIKQKMGELRVYLHPHSAEIDAAIAAAQLESAQTCEGCGAPSEIVNRGGVYTTLCDRCRERQARGG